MSVKIRLQRRGRKKQPFYHIVIADARSPRDGRFIEKIGIYNPLTKPATIDIDRDKAFEWLMKGAQPTDTVRAILRFKGILFRKHVQRGVLKGALAQEEADRLYQEWVAGKETNIAARAAKEKEETRKFHEKVAGLHLPFERDEPKTKAPVSEEAPAEAPVADEEE